jgi:hypothetical protein
MNGGLNFARMQHFSHQVARTSVERRGHGGSAHRGYPSFEHLEAEGQRLLPEQLKTMLKALARSNLLRGDAR